MSGSNSYITTQNTNSGTAASSGTAGTQSTTGVLPGQTGTAEQSSYLNGLNTFNGTPFQPYTGELTAGINPVQNTTAWNSLNLAQYQPQQVGAGNALAYTNGSGPGGLSVSGQDLSGYLNPYTQSVIDTTNTTLQNQLAQQNQGASGQAAQAGAFGGDRAAIVNAQNTYNNNLLMAQTDAGLNQANYNNAQGLATGDLNRQLQAGTTQAQLGLQAAQGNQYAGLQGANLQNQANNSAFQIGTAFQNTSQLGDTNNYNQYLRAFQYPQQNALNAATITQQYAPSLQYQGTNTQNTANSTNASNTGYNNQITTAPGPNPITQDLGYATSGVGILGSLFGGNSNNNSNNNSSNNPLGTVQSGTGILNNIGSTLNNVATGIGNGISNAYNYLFGANGGRVGYAEGGSLSDDGETDPTYVSADYGDDPGGDPGDDPLKHGLQSIVAEADAADTPDTSGGTPAGPAVPLGLAAADTSDTSGGTPAGPAVPLGLAAAAQQSANPSAQVPTAPDSPHASQVPDQTASAPSSSRPGGGLPSAMPQQPQGQPQQPPPGQPQPMGLAGAAQRMPMPQPQQQPPQMRTPPTISVPGGGNNWALPLLAAGSAMLASKSPFLGVGIGEGLQAGLGAYMNGPQRAAQAAQAQVAVDQATGIHNYMTGANSGLAGAQGGLPGGNPGGLAGAAGTGGNPATTPMFGFGNKMAELERVSLAGWGPISDNASKALNFYRGELEKGIQPAADGVHWVPIPGVAEAGAQAAGLKSYAEGQGGLPSKEAEAAFRSGLDLNLARAKPQMVGPNETLLPNGVSGFGATGGDNTGNPAPYVGAGGAMPASTYAARVEAGENSTGNPAATNPSSKAMGNGQFLEGTWLDLARKTLPQTQGMSDAQVLALRSDPTISRAMTMAYGQQNAGALAQAGIQPTAMSLGLAHRFGPGDATKLLRADPSTPMSQVVSPAVIAANPNLKGKTVGSVVGATGSRFGFAPVSFAPQAQGAQSAAGAGGGQPGATANPTGQMTYKPIESPVPGLNNMTRAPLDPPVNPQITQPAKLVRNPDGSITTVPNPYREAFVKESEATIAGTGPQIEKLASTRQELGQLHSEILTTAQSPGFQTTGFGADTRATIVSAANTLSRGLTGSSIFDPQAEANNTLFNKDSKRAAFQLASDMAHGRVALGEVNQANRSVPNEENSPQANLLITNLLMQNNMRETDRAQYVYAQTRMGKSPTDAGAAFDAANPSERYVVGALAATVPPAPVNALKAAPTPANIAAFNRMYGDHTAEVLLGIAR